MSAPGCPPPNIQQNAEFHITEWGHDSESSQVTTIRTARHSGGGHRRVGVIERAFVFEIQDGKDPRPTGVAGDCLRVKVPVPNPNPLQSLQMLNKLGAQRVELYGKGTFVKAVATP
jgi:hypothetical protein